MEDFRIRMVENRYPLRAQRQFSLYRRGGMVYTLCDFHFPVEVSQSWHASAPWKQIMQHDLNSWVVGHWFAGDDEYLGDDDGFTIEYCQFHFDNVDDAIKFRLKYIS